MVTPREDMIKTLVEAAMDGMEVAASRGTATGSEVISACLTVAARAIAVALRTEGVDVSRLRDGVCQIYALLPPEVVH
jgi:hypothetical protein